MALNTWYQTAHVMFPQSEMIFHTIRQRPVAPVDLFTNTLGLSLYDGRIMFWYKDNTVVEISTNGVRTIWYTRPTISSAIQGSAQPAHSFFQFHSDGSTTAKYNHTTYYWSPPFHASVELGEPFCQDDEMESCCSNYTLEYDSS